MSESEVFLTYGDWFLDLKGKAPLSPSELRALEGPPACVTTKERTSSDIDGELYPDLTERSQRDI